MQFHETVGQRLARLRAEKGWSQERLAVAMGLPKRAGQIKVTRWETGAVKPTADEMEAAAKALGLPTYALQEVGEIDRFVRWLEEVALQSVASGEAVDESFRTAVATVVAAFGPPPDPADREGWTVYLERLRALLLSYQAPGGGGTAPRAGTGRLSDGGSP